MSDLPQDRMYEVTRVQTRLWELALWCTAHVWAIFSAEHTGPYFYGVLMERGRKDQRSWVFGMVGVLALLTTVFSFAGPGGVAAFWATLAALLVGSARDPR